MDILYTRKKKYCSALVIYQNFCRSLKKKVKYILKMWIFGIKKKLMANKNETLPLRYIVFRFIFDLFKFLNSFFII
jgi:cbb3-type cytochrome oxidase subunit 1